MRQSTVLVVDDEKEIVATTSAWFKMAGDVRFPLIHWVSASPKEQGKGRICSFTAV